MSKDKNNWEIIDEGGCLPVFIIIVLIVLTQFILGLVKIFHNCS